MKHVPVRSCIVCREQKDKFDLLRIVRRPSGEVVLDLGGKESGRGAYICKNGDCMQNAVKKRALDRVYKTKLDGAVYERLLEEYNNAKGNE